MVLHEDQCHPPKTPYPLVANVGWLLDDFHEANGGTLVVPGSHLREARPDPHEFSETVAVLAPAGTAMILDGRLWHATGRNITPRRRHLVFTYYCVPFMRQMENYTLCTAPDVYDSASRELRALLGFTTWGNLGRTEGALIPNGTPIPFERPKALVRALRPEGVASDAKGGGTA